MTEVVETPADVVVEVDAPDVEVVEVSTPGPQGQSGPQGIQGVQGVQGPQGLASNDFVQVFYFASPSTHWAIQHNRNTFDVDVVTFDTNGTLYEGSVIYIDANNVAVDWYYPTAGQARLSS